MKQLLIAWWVAATFTGTIWHYYSSAGWMAHRVLVSGTLGTEPGLWRMLFIWVNVTCFGLLVAMNLKNIINKIRGWVEGDRGRE